MAKSTVDGDGYSLRTCRFVNGDTSQVLERECGDSIEIIHLKGVIVNEPGIVLAAVGRIPDKIKIDGDGGIWFRVPCPIFKVPNNLPLDPAARHKALLEAYEKSSEKNAFKQGFIRAYKQALGLSSEEEEDEDEEQNMDLQYGVMVEILLFGALELDGLYRNPDCIPTHPIPISQAVVESESIKYGYYISTFEAPLRGTIRLLGRDCGDHLEITYLTGVTCIKAGHVFAAGGIPRNLRLNVGISFWYPCPIFKGPKILPRDPTERKKLELDVYVKAIEANRNNFLNAYYTALFQLKPPEEEEHDTDMQPCTMMEINIAYPEGIQYYELMMDVN